MCRGEYTVGTAMRSDKTACVPQCHHTLLQAHGNSCLDNRTVSIAKKAGRKVLGLVSSSKELLLL